MTGSIIIKSDKPTLTLAAEPDGKIHVTTNSFDGRRTVLAGQQLTVVWCEGKCLVTIGPLPPARLPADTPMAEGFSVSGEAEPVAG